MSSKQQELSDVFGLGGSSGREIRFIDSRYHPLFSIPDGGNIVRSTVTLIPIHSKAGMPLV